MSEVELADESPLVSDPVKSGRVQFSGRRSEVWTQSTFGRIYSRRAAVMRSLLSLGGAYRSAIR